MSSEHKRVWRGRALVLAAVIGGSLGLLPAPTSGVGAVPVESPTCPICAHFVTTFDPDGDGGVVAVTRMHRNLVVNVPYVLDVDGVLPPVPFAPADVNAQVTVGGESLSPTVAGYELKATVETLTGERPTIRLSKLVTAPPKLPLRVEIVTGEVRDPTATKTTFGYDALSTTAPQSFVARLDLGDRDANPATQQVLVGIDISRPGQRLTILNESFTGDPAGVRTNRRIRRAELIGDPARGTQVPSALSLDLTSSATRNRIVLTRREPTTLEFELAEPGGNPQSAGRLDELPPSIDLTISDQDVNGDGTADKKIDYRGGAVIGRAELTTRNGVSTTKATLEEVPTEAHLTYATPPARTEVTYHASARATRAQIEVADAEKTFSAALRNLPPNINELTHTSTANGGKLVYRADASADHAEVHVRKGDATFDASVAGVPASIDHLIYDTPNDRVIVDHSASAPIAHAEVRFADVIPATGPTPAHRRDLTATVDGFPSSVDLVLDTAASSVNYTASERTPRIHVVVNDEQALFERATTVDMLLEDVSPGLDAVLQKEHFKLDARGDHVGRIEVVGTNTSPQRLADDEDGILIRDFGRTTNAYVLFGRVRGVRHALYLPGEERSRIELDAEAPVGTDMVVDSVRDVHDRLWTNQINETTRQHHSRDGTETIQVRLGDYPPAIVFDLNTADDEMHLDYNAARAAGPMTFTRTTNYRGDPIPVTYNRQYTADRIAGSYAPSAFDSEMAAGLDPMPAMFHACYVPRGDECSAGTWKRGMFEDFNPASSNNGGSIRFRASTRTQFTLDDRKTVSVPITYARLAEEVTEAGDACEQVVFFGLFCRYNDDKPGIATTNISLNLGDLIIQSHLESSGWVGHNVASIFAGDAANNQGYVAMDTGWRNAEIVTGAALCAALDFPPDCIIGKLFHGHYPPPPAVVIYGQIAKGGSGCVAGEDCAALESSFPIGFAAKIDGLKLDYGDPFAAEHRVFEFDPDELIFAKHRSGHVHCGAGTSLKAGSSGFQSDFCEISLPA